MPRITAALDIATSSSVSEGFPNAIGEAMSCAIPCVVTRAGESAELVDGTGNSVNFGDSEALALAWSNLIEVGRTKRAALGSAARRRIVEHYSLDAVVQQYETLYEEILRDWGTHRPGSAFLGG
jgi:glycosyltransferase involved in cell wall biosynthesis